MKPLLLDLFCGAGGAAMGYYRAGFRVVGVDIRPQPHYPFRFVQMEALSFLMQYGRRFDAIHASPPCQAFSWSARRWADERLYVDLLTPARWLLQRLGKPYVIENVEQAPMISPLTLCGVQFGLRVFRHRKFESSHFLFGPGGKCTHKKKKVGVDGNSFVTVAGHGGQGSARLDNWRDAMGIDWMNKTEITQAIPPVYTEWIGKQIIKAC